MITLLLNLDEANSLLQWLDQHDRFQSEAAHARLAHGLSAYAILPDGSDISARSTFDRGVPGTLTANFQRNRILSVEPVLHEICRALFYLPLARPGDVMVMRDDTMSIIDNLVFSSTKPEPGKLITDKIRGELYTSPSALFILPEAGNKSNITRDYLVNEKEPLLIAAYDGEGFVILT